MIRAQSIDEKTMDTRSEEDYDFCNTETSKNNCIVTFTPPSDTKICLKDRFISPRWLSKSVPRRNRNVVRYKINRSLNFDIGHHKNDYFTSPKTKGNDSPRNHLHLSRSAKILKALNIDYNPMKSGGYKKINKTLNFDLAPSPKRFSNTNKSQCHMSNLRSASPSGINKTLNFDSSEDSPIADSLHDTSVESIDENQNQTPSQRNSKVKKSLSYMSLSSNSSNTSFDFNLLSPSLRTELREKIDDIVQSSMSPNLQLIRKSPGHEKLNGGTMFANTPRNLFNNFSDEDEEEDRPETPENAIRLIPESMSAIKKSHRKERISGRFAHRIQVHIAKPIKMETAEDEEQRPLTPSTSDTQHTPNHNLRSIKKSHKKDKTRRKSCGYRSEDELSETGSLFNYSALEDGSKNDQNRECNSDEKNEIHDAEIIIQSEDINERNMNGVTMQTPLKRCPQSEDTAATTTKTDTGPTTPENRIDYLRRIMTDSIKKSHKKLKETNKKSFLRTCILEKQMNDIEKTDVSSGDDNELKDDESPSQCVTVTSTAVNRSSTPENMNSSRLLLAQFSSVKKSHKKDKHRKMGFVQRHIARAQEEENNSGSSVRQSENETRNKTSLLTFNIPQINLINASTSRSTFGSSFSSLSSEDRSEFRSLGTLPLDTSDDNEIKSMASSPNKRKSPRSDENGNAEVSSSLSNESHIEYESAEDEFKIFTPIKKRKPLIILSTPRTFDNNNTSVTYPENALSNGRCDTPKIGLDILTLERKKNCVVSEHDDDNNKCSTQAPVDDTENENGRLTPENNGRLERISALSSIKKSHKKDKWANARRRSVRMVKGTKENISECDGEMNNCSKNLNTSINNWRQSRMHEFSSDSGEKTESFDEEINPKPSTSYSDPIIESSLSSSSSIKTPPNGLGAKTYLRLIQTTSIKRSHKKMRERKKIESIILDANLSDDGSIFDETEKSFNGSEIEDFRSNKMNDSNDDFLLLDDSNVNEIGDEKVDYSKGSHSFSGNWSIAGSIFESDRETNSPRQS